jgi:tRNA-dihydrouridine synthase
LIIHGRTVKQQYRGEANWDQIKLISQKLNIPVIGSGDIINAHIAIERIKNYTPSGIMIGRGALGSPWIFAQTQKLLNNYKIRPTTKLSKVINTVLLHTRLQIKEFKQSPYYTSKYSPPEIERHAIANMRKHFGWYFKGFHNAKEFRLQLLTATTYQDLQNILKNIA